MHYALLVGSLALYAVSFVLSVVCVPVEDVMYYAYRRVPGWWAQGSLSAAFSSDLSQFLALNFFRAVFCGLAALTCMFVVVSGIS